MYRIFTIRLRPGLHPDTMADKNGSFIRCYTHAIKLRLGIPVLRPRFRNALSSLDMDMPMNYSKYHKDDRLTVCVLKRACSCCTSIVLLEQHPQIENYNYKEKDCEDKTAQFQCSRMSRKLVPTPSVRGLFHCLHLRLILESRPDGVNMNWRKISLRRGLA